MDRRERELGRPWLHALGSSFAKRKAAPGGRPFVFTLYSQDIKLRANFCRLSLDLNVLRLELQPRLGDGNIRRPRFPAKTRLRGLAERPDGEVLRTRKTAGVEIAAGVLFECNAQAFAIQGAARRKIAIDRPKAGNEQDACIRARHGVVFPSLGWERRSARRKRGLRRRLASPHATEPFGKLVGRPKRGR